MKSTQEIETRLTDMQSQLAELKSWHDKAYQKYQSDIRFWGKSEADRGELEYVADLTIQCEQEIGVLKWVLGID